MRKSAVARRGAHFGRQHSAGAGVGLFPARGMANVTPAAPGSSHVIIRGHSAILDMWTRQVKSVGRVERTITQIDLPGPSIAVVHVSGQYPPPMGVHEEVFVLVNESGNWKIHVAQQIK